jgi:hypothetical protein
MVEKTYERVMDSFLVVADEEIEVIERRRQLLEIEEDY